MKPLKEECPRLKEVARLARDAWAAMRGEKLVREKLTPTENALAVSFLEAVIAELDFGIYSLGAYERKWLWHALRSVRAEGPRRFWARLGRLATRMKRLRRRTRP